jgi:hypothetical protein
MSSSAAHESKHARRACQMCRGRKARFRCRGEVRADRDHVLCFECFRAERNRRRAHLLAEVRARQPLRAAVENGQPLTSRQIAHRWQMLHHLRADSRKAHGPRPMT